MSRLELVAAGVGVRAALVHGEDLRAASARGIRDPTRDLAGLRVRVDPAASAERAGQVGGEQAPCERRDDRGDDDGVAEAVDGATERREHGGR